MSLAVLAACGGSSESTSGTEPSSIPDTNGPSTAGPNSTTKGRERPPGPPGPTIPDGLNKAVQRWYGHLAAGACQTLLSDVERSLPTLLDEAGNSDNRARTRAYATLYRGAARACLGQRDPARTDLDEARRLLAALDPDDDSAQAPCQPQKLLVWANQTYLNRQVPLECPGTPSTLVSTTSSSSTSSTVRSSTSTTS